MIVLFQLIVSVIQQFRSIIINQKRKKLEKMPLADNISPEIEVMIPENDNMIKLKHDIVFDPPLYIQRYTIVEQVLMRDEFKGKIKKVVDFGCAEMSFSNYIKFVSGIQEVYFVDVDQQLLENSYTRLFPLTTDYLNRKTEPLNYTVFCGSIAYPDYRFMDVDAVVCIEIIEHLYPEVLEALPYNIFGMIRPLLAIFTTPNADFNILFPKFSGSRHWDHKFEWTQQQFQDWAFNITEIYSDYEVKFEGIGKDPFGSVQYGECSQMAVFIRKTNRSNIFKSNFKDEDCIFCNYELENKLECLSYGICSYKSPIKEDFYTKKTAKCVHEEFMYKQIAYVEYPVEVDTRTREEKILNNAVCKICQFGSCMSQYFIEELDQAEIPFFELVKNDKGLEISYDELSNILQEAGYRVQECNVRGTPTLCVIYLPYETMSSSHRTISESSGNNYNPDTFSDCSDWNDNSDCMTFEVPVQQEQPRSKNNLNDFNTKETKKCDVNDINTTDETKKEGESSTSAKQIECLYNSGCLSTSSIELVTPELLRQMNHGRNDNFEPFRAKSEPDGLRYKTQLMRKQNIVAVNAPLTNIPPRLTTNKSDGNVKTKAQDTVVIESEAVPEQLQSNVVEITAPIPDIENNVRRQDTVEERGQSSSNPEQENVNLENLSQEVLLDSNSNSIGSDVDLMNSDQNRLLFYGAIRTGRSPLDVSIDTNGQRESNFPNWLLNLLNMYDEESDGDAEAHFYSQGDGLGIHPSISDVSTDSSTSTSDSVHTILVAQPGNSSTRFEPTVPENDNLSDDYFSIGEDMLPADVPVPFTISHQDNQSHFEVAIEMTESELQLLRRQNEERKSEDKENVCPEQSTSKKKD